MTPDSDTSEAIAARRARLLMRQARVGILRNPVTPPRPPQRKAQLMGKWPSLQSARRPRRITAPATATTGNDTMSDADLARLMKAALQPLPPAAEPAMEHLTTAAAGPPAANAGNPPATKPAPANPRMKAPKWLFMGAGALILAALAFFAALA